MHHPGLLNADDPAPFTLINADAGSPVVVVCDHARNVIPATLKNLGLTSDDLSRHVAWDIGAAWLAESVRARFDAALVLAGFSRLVVDLNRHLDDPTSIPAVSDGIEVPGNRDLSRQQAAQRIEALFLPYHNQVAATLEHTRTRHGVPLLVSVHSFTPSFRGFDRPWHVGVLWNRDDRVARPMLDRLKHRPDLCVGENQPYHARDPVGYTMDVHAEGNGFPHLLLEVRQDLISTREEAQRWGELLCDELEQVLKDQDVFTVMEIP